MKIPESFKRWVILATILLVGLPTFALGNDMITLKGEYLSPDELADTRGGFSLPGGGFMEFSMDYMRLQFLGDNEAGNAETSSASTWINSVRQRVSITDEGIEFNMDVLQGSSENESSGDTSGDNYLTLDPGSTSEPFNGILAQNSFTGFSGFANTNLVAGNYNTSSIVNIFNIKVNFFNARDFNPAPFLGLVIP